jgi:hypothetical protein
MDRTAGHKLRGAELIDWHAQHISNPLDRLRYLRAATIQSPASDLSKRWRYAAPLALAAIVVSSVASLRAWRGSPHVLASRPAQLPQVAQTVSTTRLPDVWLVEQSGENEEYSNGLRVDNHWVVGNRPRSYAVFDAIRIGQGPVAWRNEPVGIVLHTTESDQVPFEPVHNRVLKSIAANLLGYIQRKRAYNFVVDRFGRVHRIVKETDAANHAGYSVWADEKWLYLNLNDSFLGISFEAQTSRGDKPAGITPAQVRAGALLIEMLRARYRLPAGNCITHAQVSVNPANRQIGYHTDWAANFPYREMGLPDNYSRLLPGLYLCGFAYDRAYLTSTGAPIETAVALSEIRLAEAAATRHMGIESYRDYLQKEYRKKISALRKGAPEGDAS